MKTTRKKTSNSTFDSKDLISLKSSEFGDLKSRSTKRTQTAAIDIITTNIINAGLQFNSIGKSSSSFK